MSQGYCTNCKTYYNEGKICGHCGRALIFAEQTNNSPESKKIEKSFFRSKYSINSSIIIGLILLLIYNMVGLIISFNISKKILKSQQGFLYKIEISHFWLWLFFLINIMLLVGAILLNKNKSLVCVLGQGIIWMVLNAITVVKLKTIDIEKLNIEESTTSWKNGAVVHFPANSEISRLVCVVSYSIAHLFVILIWILAVALLVYGSYKRNIKKADRV